MAKHQIRNGTLTVTYMYRIMPKITHLFLCSDLGALVCVGLPHKNWGLLNTLNCVGSAQMCAIFGTFLLDTLSCIHRTQYLCAKTAHCSMTPHFTIFPLSVSVSFHNQVLKIIVSPPFFFIYFANISAGSHFLENDFWKTSLLHH